MNTLNLKDFQPINDWKIDVDGQKWESSTDPVYIIDQTTSKKYWNHSKGSIQVKCVLLTLGTPIVHPVSSTANILYRVVKIISLFHFWGEVEEGKSSSLKARAKRARNDCLRVLTAPIALIGLELSSIYGVVNPYDGRKLYASIERACYGKAVLARCFQPSPTGHTFGGDPLKRDAY